MSFTCPYKFKTEHQGKHILKLWLHFDKNFAVIEFFNQNDISIIGPIWTQPIHFGHDQFILVVTKSLWSGPIQFGRTKTILDRPKLFWSHRRTRHMYLTGRNHEKF